MKTEHGIEDFYISVMANNGDGTETEMTLDEFKENCLFEVSVYEVCVKN